MHTPSHPSFMSDVQVLWFARVSLRSESACVYLLSWIRQTLKPLLS